MFFKMSKEGYLHYEDQLSDAMQYYMLWVCMTGVIWISIPLVVIFRSYLSMETISILFIIGTAYIMFKSYGVFIWYCFFLLVNRVPKELGGASRNSEELFWLAYGTIFMAYFLGALTCYDINRSSNYYHKGILEYLPFIDFVAKVLYR